MWLKDLLIPFSNQQKTIEVAQLWEVRWTSRKGVYHFDLRPEMEAFLSEREANDFAVSLRQAFALVRNTSKEEIGVSVKKAQERNTLKAVS